MRPVRIVAAGSPGGASDILARLLNHWLAERLGQPFIVENRPGGSSNIAAEAVVRAPPDGHTLLVVSPTSAINATLYPKLPYNFLRDIAPVAALIRVPLIVLVRPSSPINSIPALIAYGTANPGAINFASGGNSTMPRMSAELFKMMTGMDMTHVPYRGEAPALTDLLAGQVQMMFATSTASIELVKSGQLRPLAVTTAKRLDALPQVPSLSEFVPQYEASSWFGIGAPKKTPVDIVDELNRQINAGLADPKLSARLNDMSGVTLLGSPDDFRDLIATETVKWAKVINFAGIGPD